VRTSKISPSDSRLVRFHGCYQQKNADLEEERKSLGLESAFAFTVRVRLPGGRCEAEQWQAMNDIFGRYAGGNPKIANGQTLQVGGIAKRDVKKVIRSLNQVGMDTLGTCGDICHNVMCTADPSVCSRTTMEEILHHAQEMSNHCLSKSSAYHEIFLTTGADAAEKNQVLGASRIEEEPLYGLAYLPNKLKVGIAIPPNDDVDIFAQTLGFIAILHAGKLEGFNVVLRKTLEGKGRHVIGFCTPRDAKYVLESFLTLSRDLGDRVAKSDLVEDYSPSNLREMIEEELGHKLAAPREYSFNRRNDLLGWHKADDGLWHCGCNVPAGRIRGGIRVGLAKIAEELQGIGSFRMTCHQQIVISDIPDSKKESVQQLLTKYKILQSMEPGKIPPKKDVGEDNGSDSESSEMSTESGQSCQGQNS